jgi:hypothetical protein
MTTTRRSEALGLQDWATLQTEIVSCCRCPRLVAWRESVALQKVARFREQLYWGKTRARDSGIRRRGCG